MFTVSGAAAALVAQASAAATEIRAFTRVISGLLRRLDNYFVNQSEERCQQTTL
jgi:hypothetical protein